MTTALPIRGEAISGTSAKTDSFEPSRSKGIYRVRPRREPNVSYRLLRAINPAFRVLFPNQVIRVDDLARTMVDLAVRGPGEGRTLVLD